MPIRNAASTRLRIVSALALLLVAVGVASWSVVRHDQRLSPTEAAVFFSGGQVPGLTAPAWLRADPALEQARTTMRTTYERLSAIRIGPIARWSAAHRLDRRLAFDTVFYPFGGPDAAFPLALFPSAREYILIGLEPVLDASGRDPLHASDAQVLIHDLPVSLADYAGKGFFVTHKMSSAHEERRFPGVLAMILATLGGLRGEVRAVEYVCLGGGGDTIDIVDRATVAENTARRCGARIRFRMPRSVEEKTLLYLSLSLGDQSLTAHPALETLLSTRNYVVFCKAAQYFMHGAHGGSFDTVTRLSLGGAGILQDDTCVPLRLFDRDQWDLSFFGSYRLYSQYKHMLQPDLARIYADRTSVRPVPQVAGYSRHTNFMLGVRRQGP